MTKAECPVCGDTFEKRTRNQVYCSIECRESIRENKRNPWGFDRDNPRDYADDCIHLHACRRLAKIAKDGYGISVTRGCYPDTCKAYTPESDDTPKRKTTEADTWITVSDAAKYARSVAYMIRGGYDEYDVFVTSDFADYCPSATYGRVIKEADDD